MYTRCPSCRAEISFEPPANMERLPDGYKHRIKCPSCGVTIGVKISRVDTTPQQAPEYTQSPFEPVYANEESVAPQKSKAKSRAKATMPKRSGVGRNIIMMILSLLFIAIGVLGYYAWGNRINIGTLLGIGENNFGIGGLDGITYWKNLIYRTDSFVAYFSDNVWDGIITILPMIVFTLACLNFVVAFISACGKKYGRAYNFISSILIGAGSIAPLFIEAQYIAQTEGKANIWQGLLSLFNGDNLINNAALVVFAVLGLLQFIFGLCFIKSLKKKQI